MDATQSLDRHKYLSLATFRSTGAEVRTPVWFAPVDGKLLVVTAGDSGKAKRLRRSSRARIAPCTAQGKILGEWRDVEARLVTDPATIARASAALKAKYGWRARLLNLVSRVSGRMRHRAWIEITVHSSPLSRGESNPGRTP